MKGSRQTSAVLVAVLGVASASAEAQLASGSFQRTLTVERLQEVTVTTGSGNIDVHKGEAGRVAVSGRIVVGRTRTRSKADDVDLRTGSGSVDLGRPVRISGQARKDRLTGRVGGGGPLIRVRTGSGDIRVR